MPPESENDTAELFQLAYDTLHGMALNYLKRERHDHTLQPTALVHEAFLKLDGFGKEAGYRNKAHFQAVAARAMRQILVDHARRRKMLKRGGEFERVNLDSGVLGVSQDIDLLALEESLEQLAALDARKAQVVEMRYYGGMTAAEIGTELGVSRKTVDADWYFSRAWLRKQLSL